MKVLVLGSGGREHCIIWKISKSKDIQKIFCLPGNAGISDIAECANISLAKDNFLNIQKFIEKNSIDLTIVGPEAPLVDGIVDFLSSKGHLIFGPNKKGARIEGSKVFTKKLAIKYGIPTANANFFKKEDYKLAKLFVEGLNENSFPYVIKADGLAAGKGVIICTTKKELVNCVDDFFIKEKFGKSGDEIIIEEFLDGFEVSVLCLCDGESLIPMELAQDYKKVFDGDKGKNTGGMGSYSPVPFINEALYKKILNKIIFPTYEALKKEGIVYKGILYGGIIVNNDEPYLLEYNCRFGDPETQVILPRLKNDLLELLLKSINGELGNNIVLEWEEQKAICVVIASNGYPESYSKGDIINGLDRLSDKENIFVFHAGTKKINNNIVTDGGRVLNVVGLGNTFKEAREIAYDGIKMINFNGMQYRKDIALKVIDF